MNFHFQGFFFPRTGAQTMTVVFSKPEKRTQWEETFTEAKQKLATSVEKHPTPEFISSVPIRKTRAGLQFTCASPTLGGQKDVWVCNSDGYVGQVMTSVFINFCLTNTLFLSITASTFFDIIAPRTVLDKDIYLSYTSLKHGSYILIYTIYFLQVCVLSLLPEPTVTSCNGVCNAKILCVASVPASIEK